MPPKKPRVPTNSTDAKNLILALDEGLLRRNITATKSSNLNSLLGSAIAKYSNKSVNDVLNNYRKRNMGNDGMFKLYLIRCSLTIQRTSISVEFGQRRPICKTEDKNNGDIFEQSGAELLLSKFSFMPLRRMYMYPSGGDVSRTAIVL